jgi:MFS family permease
LSLLFTVGGIFFLNAFIIASWLTRLPDVMYALGIDKTTTGLALLAAPIGSMLAAPFVGNLIDRHAPGRISMWSGVGVSVALALVAVATGPVTLALALLVAGLINGGMEIGSNASADAAEKATGRHIMARCHGFWSIGFMSGALTSSGFAALEIPYTVHLPVVGGLGVAACLALARVLPAMVYDRPVPRPGAEKAPMFALPGKETAGICLMAIGITLAEGAIYDWGTLFLREDIGVTQATASLGAASFTLAMAIGRLGGDVVRARFPARTIVRVCAVLAGAGMTGLVFSPNIVLACAALVLMGFGVSLVFPVAVTAIAARGGPSAASNLAALSLAVMGSLFVAPPFIGFVGDHWGLPAAFLMMLPLIALTGLLAGEAAPRRAAAGPLSPAGGSA